MSVKLLRIEGDAGSATSSTKGAERVSVLNEGLMAIRQLPQIPINLITIWGPARSGKSFLMNTLVQVEDMFPVSDSMKPCTVGADISTTVRNVSDLNGDSVRESVEAYSPMIGFVDVEGQGDRHLSCEILLATPLLLLSKVVIFNWKGLPNKSTILDRLAAMRESANDLNRQQRENAFGHLIILLRDMCEGGKDAEKVILDPEDATSAETDEEEEQVNARNKARDLLRQSFCTIRVCCLPSPHHEIYDRRISLNEVDAKFTGEVDQLRSTLVRLVQEPHRFGGKSIYGGPTLESLLIDVCKAVNEGSKHISPMSMMDSIQNQRAEALYQEAKESFSALATKLTDGPPKSKADMKTSLEEAKQTTLAKFAENTKDLPEKFVSKAQERLEEVIDGLSKACLLNQQAQVEAARSRLVEIAVGCALRGDEKVKEILRMLPINDESELVQLWKAAINSIYSDVEDDIRKQVPSSLSEDLGETYTSSQNKWKQNLEGKLEWLMDVNRSTIASKSEEDGVRREHEERLETLMKDHDKRLKDQQEDFARMTREHEAHIGRAQAEINRLRSQSEGSPWQDLMLKALNIVVAVTPVALRLLNMQSTSAPI